MLVVSTGTHARNWRVLWSKFFQLAGKDYLKQQLEQNTPPNSHNFTQKVSEDRLVIGVVVECVKFLFSVTHTWPKFGEEFSYNLDVGTITTTFQILVSHMWLMAALLDIVEITYPLS